MNELNNAAFINLFKEAYQKCFGFQLLVASSETESKHFGNKIFEATGLVIGAKSLKNYSQYVIDGRDTRAENPSVATLDTLARYVLGAPYTTEAQRKDNEGHYPYWYQFKSAVGVKVLPPVNNINEDKKPARFLTAAAVLLILVTIAALILSRQQTGGDIRETFISVNNDSLTNHGWQLKNIDEGWWNRRDANPAALTLYTLRGDNWADSANAPAIKNLLLRKLPGNCFESEIHFENFIPGKQWQQAGILLLEDTTLLSKSVRLSIAFNDFFGGYDRPKEVIVQAINSNSTDLSKPEEIAHLPLFNFEPGKENLVAQNLQKSALKIEKHGKHFRFLYATGTKENFAFKEALSKDLDINPKYIAIFALQGFVNTTNIIPVKVKYFSVNKTDCR